MFLLIDIDRDSHIHRDNVISSVIPYILLKIFGVSPV